MSAEETRNRPPPRAYRGVGYEERDTVVVERRRGGDQAQHPLVDEALMDEYEQVCMRVAKTDECKSA